MKTEEIGCQTFNKRLSWKALAEDKYYSSASKNWQLQDNRMEVRQTQ